MGQRGDRGPGVDLEIGRTCHIELPSDAITIWPMADQATPHLS
jgi:hypothetical protein